LLNAAIKQEKADKNSLDINERSDVSK